PHAWAPTAASPRGAMSDVTRSAADTPSAPAAEASASAPLPASTSPSLRGASRVSRKELAFRALARPLARRGPTPAEPVRRGGSRPLRAREGCRVRVCTYPLGEWWGAAGTRRGGRELSVGSGDSAVAGGGRCCGGDVARVGPEALEEEVGACGE